MSFQIEKKAFIHLGCKFSCARHLILKKNSVLNQFCHIDNRGGVVIGENVSLATQVKIVTADHNMYDSQCSGRSYPVVIEDYVFIGFGALILGNSHLQKGSVIGALSIFKGLTEPFFVYIGNPAKAVRRRPENLNYKMDYDRLFH